MQGISKRSVACLILGASLLLLAQFVGAEVRDSICIIKPQMPEATKKLNQDISNIFRRSGNGDLSDEFKKEAEAEVFGSGFLVKASDGSIWVITNRHVVGNATIAQLTFEKSDGTATKIENCQISYIDDRLDLAFIELPAGTAAPSEALGLATTVPIEGTDVWSAGYPGLINKPSWQLGRGIISNRNLIVEELGAKEDAVYVQHTAPIDPGNSGGPLLVGDIKDTASLKVIGVNTWSAVGRNNTFFSVSVTKITEALARAAAFRSRKALEGDKKIAAEQQALTEKAKKLEDFINAKEFNQFQYLSLVGTAMVIDQGFKPMFEKLRRMNTKERTEWLSIMVNESALHGLCKFESKKLWDKYHKDAQDFKFVAIDEPNTLAKGEQSVSFSSGKTTIHMVWNIESGNWVIRALDKNDIKQSDSQTKADKPAKSDKDKNSDKGEEEEQFSFRPVGLVIGGGLALLDPAAQVTTPGGAAYIGFDFSTIPFIGVNVGLAFYKASPTKEAVASYNYNNYPKKMNTSWLEFSLDLGIKAQLPINIGAGYVMPYVGGGLAVNIPLSMSSNGSYMYSGTMPDINFDISYFLDFGLEFSFNKKLAIGASMTFYNSIPISSSVSFTRSMPVQIYIKPLFNN